MTSSVKNTKRMKLYVAMQIPKELVEFLESNNLDVHVAKKMPMTRQELLKEIAQVDCDAIFCTPSITLDKELFELTPNLKVNFKLRIMQLFFNKDPTNL